MLSISLQDIASGRPTEEPDVGSYHVVAEEFSVFYGKSEAVRRVSLGIPRNRVTAIIGPSGCGKSTLLRAINRMNDLIPDCRAAGSLVFDGQDVYGPRIDVVALRRRIGMVFQKPNPFPKSVFDNVAYGPRIHSRRSRHEMERGGRAQPAARRPLGGGEGPAGRQRAGPLRRPAAEALHRPCAGHRPGHPADGRADQRPGPALHRPHRGPDRRVARELHHHYRDP